MNLWPRNMTGQLMLAVALALLVVQAFGSFFVYKAQDERREAEFVHSAAFRIAIEVEGEPHLPGERAHDHMMHGDQRRPFGRFRLIRSQESPARPGEPSDAMAGHMLKRILADRGIAVAQVTVIHRAVRDDPQALARARQRAAYLGNRGHMPEGSVMIAGVRIE